MVKMAGEEREREALAFDRDILRERERERERDPRGRHTSLRTRYAERETKA